MSDDFLQIDQLAGTLLRNLDGGPRRRLLRKLSRDLQASQRQRITRQENPDGTPFAPRKPRRDPKVGRFPRRFLYPTDGGEMREAIVKSYVLQENRKITGFDIKAGAIRTFFLDKMKSLPWEGPKAPASGGKLRRKGRIRKKAMFRRMKGHRYLIARSNADEAWVGFTGYAATIANINQAGAVDRPGPRSKPTRYPQRKLVGFTDADRKSIMDAVLAALVDGVA